MFAFYPERGSLMEDWPAVDRGQWRRVQLGRYLVDFCDARVTQMRFDAAGRVVDFGVADRALAGIIASGKPFRTSGCPGEEGEEVSACNRPFGDSPPTDILSFPFAPAPADIDAVRRQMAGQDVRAGLIDAGD